VLRVPRLLIDGTVAPPSVASSLTHRRRRGTASEVAGVCNPAGYLAPVCADLHVDVERWREWIRGPIRDDMIDMHFRRLIWKRVGEIAEANREVRNQGSAFWDFLRDTYAVTQAIAIRRQADTDRRVCSLALVIKQMRDNAEALTRDSYVSLWDQNDELLVQRGQRNFDLLAGEGGDHLDPAIPTADLEALKAAAERVRIYVNEHIAHDMANPTIPEMPTYSDLHDAIDALGEICKKYFVVLTADSMHTWEPFMQHDWEAIFRVAWLPPRPR
jgi:hypothetical protein